MTHDTKKQILQKHGKLLFIFSGGGGTSLNKKKLGKSCGPPQIVFRTQQPGLDYAAVPNVTAGKSHGVAMALMVAGYKAPEMLEVLQRIMI